MDDTRRSLNTPPAPWPEPPRRRQRLLQGRQQEVKDQQFQQLETLLLQRRTSFFKPKETSEEEFSFENSVVGGDDGTGSSVSGASSGGSSSFRTSSTYRSNESLQNHRRRVERHRNQHTLGVSVHWLKYGFLEEVKQAGLTERATIYDIEDLRSDQGGIIRRKGQHVVCPIDNQLGSAYVHALGKSKDRVGCSNFMLSYVWGYPIGDIIDALWDHCSLQGLDPKRTYIWICCLCVNQHRVRSNIKLGKEIPFRTFRHLFYSRAKAIGHILALFAPWDSPRYIERVWTVFEFFTASTDGHNVTIIMPPKEKREMATLIATKGDHAFLHRLYKALQNTKVEEAKASYESDKTRILQLVERNYKLCHFNAKVNELLRRCVLDSVLRFAVTLDKVDTLSVGRKQDFLTNVGRIVLARGEYEDSLEKYTAAIANLNQFGLVANRESRASCHDIIGSMLLRKNDLDGARQQFIRALSIRKERSGLSSRKNPLLGKARSKLHFGHLLFHQERYEEARVNFDKALSIIASMRHGEDHPETAQIYDALGMVWCKLGDPDGALSYLHKALDIRKVYLGANHPATAESRNNIGVAHFQKGNWGEATAYHRKALSSRLSLLGPDHPDTATSQNDLANVLFHSRIDIDEALQLYRSAHSIRTAFLGLIHPDTQKSFDNICAVAAYHDGQGAVLFTEHDGVDSALEKCHKAYSIRSSLLGADHPDTKASHSNLRRAAEYFSNVGEKRYSTRDCEGALRYHQKALRVRKALLGRDHPESTASCNDLCQIAKSCFDGGFNRYIASFPDDKLASNEGAWSFHVSGGSSIGGMRPFCQTCWTQIERNEPRFVYEPNTLTSTWFYHCHPNCLSGYEASHRRVLEAMKQSKEDEELGFVLQDLLTLTNEPKLAEKPSLDDSLYSGGTIKLSAPPSKALLRPSIKDTPRLASFRVKDLKASSSTFRDKQRLRRVTVASIGYREAAEAAQLRMGTTSREKIRDTKNRRRRRVTVASTDLRETMANKRGLDLPVDATSEMIRELLDYH